MKRLRKIVLTILTILVVVLVLGLVAYWLFADDLVAREVRAAVRKQTGAEIALGDVRVDGLSGVELLDVTLTDPADDDREVFFAERIDVRLAALPWPGQPVRVARVRVANVRTMAVREEDGRLNFQRLLDVEREPGEPGKPRKKTPVIVERIELAGADLAMLFKGMAEQSAADPVTVADVETGIDDEAQTDPLVTLNDVAVTLELADARTMRYDATLAIGDTAWGPTTLAGTVQAAPLEVDVRTTDGRLRLTPRTAATLPGLAPRQAEQMAPEATISLERFALAGTPPKPRAEVRIEGIGATLPALGRVDGAALAIDLADGVVTVRTLAVPPVDVPGLGTVDDAKLVAALNLDTWTLAVTELSASMLGGTLNGSARVPDLRADVPVPEGKLTLSGAESGNLAAGVPVAANGSLTFGPTASDAGVPQLEAELDGRLAVRSTDRGGAAARTIPVKATVLADLQPTLGPIGFDATVRDDRNEIDLALAGRYAPWERLATFERGRLRVVLTEGTLALADELSLPVDALRRLKPRGTVSAEVAEQTTVPVANPLAVRGVAIVSSQRLTLTLPERGSTQSISFVALAGPAPQDSGAAFRAHTDVERLDAPGKVTATALLGPDGAPQSVVADVSDLEITGQLVRAIAPLLPPTSDALRSASEGLAVVPEFFSTAQGHLETSHGKGGALQSARGSAEWTFRGGDAFRILDLDLKPGKSLDLDAEAAGVTLSGELLAALRPIIVAARPEAEAQLNELTETVPQFTARLGGTAKLRVDLSSESPKVTFQQPGHVRLADGAVTVRLADGAELPVTDIAGQATLSSFDAPPDDGAAGMPFAVDGHVTASAAGGRVRAEFGQTAQAVRAEVKTERRIDLASLPRPLIEKMACVQGGRVDVTARAGADTWSGLASTPARFTVDVEELRIAMPEDDPAEGAGPSAPRSIVAAVRADGTVVAGEERVDDLTVTVTDARDQAGRALLPPRSELVLTAPSVGFDGRVEGATIRGTQPAGRFLAANLAFAPATKRLRVRDLDTELGAETLRVIQMFAGDTSGVELTGGSLRAAGRLEADTSAILDTATYTLDLAVRNLAGRRGSMGAAGAETGEALPPLDATIALERTDAGKPHAAHFSTNDADYGPADVRASYDATAGALSARARMTDFNLPAQLLAVAAPNVIARLGTAPTGTLNTPTPVAVELVRADDGSWQARRLEGKLRATDVHSQGRGRGGLTFSNVTLTAALSPERVLIESGGTLAGGTFELTAPIRPTSDHGPWYLDGATVLARRIDLRQFEAVARRPANELNGRLTLDMKTGEGYGLSGALPELAYLGEPEAETKLASWQGRGRATFGEGHLWQVPLMQRVRLKLFKGVAATLQRVFDPTSFRKADTEFVIADGELHLPPVENEGGLQHLAIDSAIIRMVMDGDVGFDGTLDLHAAASLRVDDIIEGPARLIPGIDDLRQWLDKIPGGELPILFSFYHITGTYSDPVVQTDTGRTLKAFADPVRNYLERGDEQSAVEDSGAGSGDDEAAQPAEDGQTDPKRETPVRDLIEDLFGKPNSSQRDCDGGADEGGQPEEQGGAGDAEPEQEKPKDERNTRRKPGERLRDLFQDLLKD